MINNQGSAKGRFFVVILMLSVFLMNKDVYKNNIYDLRQNGQPEFRYAYTEQAMIIEEQKKSYIRFEGKKSLSANLTATFNLDICKCLIQPVLQRTVGFVSVPSTGNRSDERNPDSAATTGAISTATAAEPGNRDAGVLQSDAATDRS